MKTPQARHDRLRTRVHKDKKKYDRKATLAEMIRLDEEDGNYAELNQVGWDEWLWPFYKKENFTDESN